jgi:hypothetical protein
MEEVEDSDDSETVTWLLPEVRQELEDHKKFKRYFPESQREAVEAYAKDHPFYTQADDAQTEELIEEYKRDIYVFARASGMGKHAATVEVVRAKASWEQHAGVGEGLQLEFESDSELEMFKAPKLKDAAGYYPETPVVQVLDVQISAPVFNATRDVNAASGVSGKKRKHSKVEQEKTEKEKDIQKMAKLAKQHKKKEKKKEKKAKKAKRLAKQAEKEDKFAKSWNQPGPKDHTADDAEMEDVNDSAESEEMMGPTFHQVSAPMNTKAPKNRPKLGPTTSDYFAKPAIPESVEEQSTIAGNFVEGPKPSGRSLARKRKREREKANALEAAKSGQDMSPLQASQQLSTDSGAPANAVTSGPVSKSQDSQASADGASKRKRKKKRNNNRLSESQAQPKETQKPIHALEPAQHGQEHNQPSQLQVEKRLRTHVFVQNLPSAEVPIYQLPGLDTQPSLQSMEASQTLEDKLLRKADRAKMIEEDISPEDDSGSESDNEAPKLNYAKITKISRESIQVPTNTVNKEPNPKLPENGAGQQHQRRDRGRGRSLKSPEGKTGPPEPLTELNNTNFKSPRLQQNDSGKHSNQKGIEQNQALKPRHP